MTRVRRGWKAACLGSALALTSALSACGGGGSTTTIILAPQGLGKQWRGTELSDRALAIVPGGGYALVGDTPEIDWLAFQTSTAAVDVRQASYSASAWQTAPTPRATGVHGVVFGESSSMSRAGGWTVMIGRMGAEIWAQMAGPDGEMSAAVALTSAGGARVHAVVDASGKARVYWSETQGAVTVTRAMHFNGTTPVDDGQVAGMSMDLLRVVAGPDGKGWLFYRQAGAQYARTVDAVAGLGTPTRMDEPARGAIEPDRLALAESTGRVTTLALQNVGTSSPCVGVRRLDAGTWSATHCANTDAAQGVGGALTDLAVEPGGRAAVIWSGGSGDDTLYGAARRADGSWTTPRVVATAASGAVLESVQTRVHTNGAAIVVYRQADGVSTATPYAVMFDAANETWGTPERFDPDDGGPSDQLSVAFNSRGEPGVLNFANQGGGRHQVRFAGRIGGRWMAVSLQNDASLAAVDSGGTSYLASMQRLTPLGDGGWAAFWELSSNLIPGYGHRVVAAAYQ